MNSNGYKYCLIVSQYYHSRHMFIVKIEDNFLENAREFAVELMEYKRSESTKGTYLGDLGPTYSNSKTEMRSRYNINDAGDIYFMNYGCANSCMLEAFKYKEDSQRESVGFKRKDVLHAISEHHEYFKVREILTEYFEIA